MSDVDLFEQFWQAYPKRSAKIAARKAFDRAIRLTTLETMLTALAWQKLQPQWLKDGGAYIPLPTTWLNQGRWDDQPVTVAPVSTKTLSTMRAIYGD